MHKVSDPMVRKVTFPASKKIGGVAYVDTRSPAEFELDHIPGAASIPILDNEERAIVGTLYKRTGKKEALERAMEIYIPKIRSIKQGLLPVSENRKRPLAVYCWRGGLRSSTITRLALEAGIDAVQLDGGYRHYREHVRESLQSYALRPKLVVLHGYTGSGKTELLQHFRNKIDLEGLAQHRSSVFGAVGLRPRTQKMFESLLLHGLDGLQGERFIIIEGESRKVGNIFLPDFLARAMAKGIHVKVCLPIEKRAKRIAGEYLTSEENIQEVRAMLPRIGKRLGKNRVLLLDALLEKADPESLHRFSLVLLRDYYDPLYSHSIKGLGYPLEVDSRDMEKAAGSIKRFLSGYAERD